MKILSYQPFSVYASGGGARILRRLYENHESQVSSLFIKTSANEPKKGTIDEHHVQAFPIQRPWMRWYLRDWVNNLRVKTFRDITMANVRKAAREIPHDVVHVLNHGPFSTALCEEVRQTKKKLWVSFHDHFATTSSLACADQLWKQADRRLVISQNLGDEYARLFGEKPYEIITDGVLSEEISAPAELQEEQIVVYFAGLLHFEYLPLFEVLAEALTQLTDEGYSIKLILRGTQNVPFLSNRKFEVEYRPMTLDTTELKSELDSATFLYLPMKFVKPTFYLYSLSTKMVGYLSAPGSILYHGPEDSAASKLLKEFQSAICCHSLKGEDLSEAMKELILQKNTGYSLNAKRLAREKFDLSKIRNKFWAMDNSILFKPLTANANVK